MMGLLRLGARRPTGGTRRGPRGTTVSSRPCGTARPRTRVHDLGRSVPPQMGSNQPARREGGPGQGRARAGEPTCAGEAAFAGPSRAWSRVEERCARWRSERCGAGPRGGPGDVNPARELPLPRSRSSGRKERPRPPTSRLPAPTGVRDAAVAGHAQSTRRAARQAPNRSRRGVLGTDHVSYLPSVLSTGRRCAAAFPMRRHHT